MQLINANGIYSKMRKSLGSKRNEFSDEQIGRVMDPYRAFDEYTPPRPSADILAEIRELEAGIEGRLQGLLG